MDTRADIVEVFDDETGRKDRRTGKTQQLRRYKDDAYRCLYCLDTSFVQQHAQSHANVMPSDLLLLLLAYGLSHMHWANLNFPPIHHSLQMQFNPYMSFTSNVKQCQQEQREQVLHCYHVHLLA